MSIKTEENGGWIGITDKYWMAALIPDQNTNSNFTFDMLIILHHTKPFYLSFQKFQQMEKLEIVSGIFWAKKLNLLDKYEEFKNQKF